MYVGAKYVSKQAPILPLHKRKLISKIRFSDHYLEIEKGMHLKMDQTKRTCTNYALGAVEKAGAKTEEVV